MRQLVALGIVGFIAQLVDGSLGMAYEASSATLLFRGSENTFYAGSPVN